MRHALDTARLALCTTCAQNEQCKLLRIGPRPCCGEATSEGQTTLLGDCGNWSRSVRLTSEQCCHSYLEKVINF